jgi:hypothetical protein
VRRTVDFDARETLVDAIFADLDFADLKIAAAGDNFIQHLGQNQGIDDVATELDCLGKHPGNLAHRNHRASQPAVSAVIGDADSKRLKDFRRT